MAKKKLLDPFGREVINKSKYEFCKDNEYYNKDYACELCGEVHHWSMMSSCERCLRFVCDKCSEAVVNREHNKYKYDFLCNECISELDKTDK